tara:strand:+ start:266 stop:631 length:366 start_codon:yes stop_codon:yes gene_type:complete
MAVTTSKYEKQILKCAQELVDAYEDTELSFVSMVNVITKTVELVESYCKVPGHDKKEIVINVVVHFLEKHIHDKERRVALIDFVETVGDNIIDVVVFASKGGFALNAKKGVSFLKKNLVCC